MKQKAKKAQAVLEVVASNPRLNYGQIAKRAGCSYSYAHKVLSTVEPVALHPTDNQLQIEQSANDKQVGGSHYKDMPVQPWDVMQAVLTPEEFRGFLKGNIIKYSMRAGRKQGSDDGAKAQHYREKLAEMRFGF